MAAHAVIYDDEVVLWLADQVERMADRPPDTTIATVPAGWRSGRTHRS